MRANYVEALRDIYANMMGECGKQNQTTINIFFLSDLY